jgi:hypothetical protein
MSVYTARLPFLQTSPKVWVEDNRLFARTSLMYQILNIFSYSRKVVVDKKRKVIDIIIKTFWICKSYERIPFNDLMYIDISRREVGTEFGITPDGYDARDIIETFYVQVKTQSNPIPINLFRFTGDGGKYTGWFGVLLGDSAIDFEGRQQEKALHYAEQVSEFTSIPLWRNRKLELSFKVDQQYKCPSCGHLNTSVVKKCMYCGNPLDIKIKNEV